ncbi:alpha/beta fold hydrolase, partial [Lysinibacillus sp. D4B1_S16]|uniref:alpha/beta fold hydrolase n=1 Tax=Lysinibacillus sp. D4B1_S16 TaxID=2941231 RepID=UPI0020BD78DF
MDALQLLTFDMIGWSTGGAVCLQFAANYPDYCQRLIVLASASTRGYPFDTDLGTGNPASYAIVGRILCFSQWTIFYILV